MDAIFDYLKAFAVGGLFCVVAQIFIDRTKVSPARILVSYVVAGVLLGSLGVYKPIIDFAGCGATVPLTGFGYLISKGVKEAILKDGPIGIITGALTATAGGITVALVAGFVSSLIFSSKPKSM